MLKENALTYSSNESYQSESRRRAQLSRHAEKRTHRQRCINKQSVALVLAFGEREFDGSGGIRFFMTAAAVASARHAMGQTSQIEALAGVCAVVSLEDQMRIHVGSS